MRSSSCSVSCVVLDCVGQSSIASSSSSTADAASAPAVNPSETSINGSQVVAVGTPMPTVSAAATGYQNIVMVSKVEFIICHNGKC